MIHLCNNINIHHKMIMLSIERVTYIFVLCTCVSDYYSIHILFACGKCTIQYTPDIKDTLIGIARYKGDISWDRIISLYFSLNKPVIRDSYIGYKGQFGTEYVRNVNIISLFSKPCIFCPFMTALNLCNDSVCA